MMQQQNKSPYFISHKKEMIDTNLLVSKIKEDKWIDDSVVIVCCFPYYSSIVAQLTNHKLSHLNKNELFEQVNMEFPYPNMSQVWNSAKEEWQLFDIYISSWIKKYARPDNKYLFISSTALTGKNLIKLKLSIKDKIDNYKFASLYVNKNSALHPHYYIESIDYEEVGRPIFEWENTNNPNWKTVK